MPPRLRLLLGQALQLVAPAILAVVISYIFEGDRVALLAFFGGAVVYIVAGFVATRTARFIGRGPAQGALQFAVPTLVVILGSQALGLEGVASWIAVAAAPTFAFGLGFGEAHQLFDRIDALRPIIRSLPSDILRHAQSPAAFPSQIEAARFLCAHEPSLTLDEAHLLATRVRWDGSRFQLIYPR